jgi:hypothetical protein
MLRLIRLVNYKLIMSYHCKQFMLYHHKQTMMYRYKRIRLLPRSKTWRYSETISIARIKPLATRQNATPPIAQTKPHNQRVAGSSPAGPTNKINNLQTIQKVTK